MTLSVGTVDVPRGVGIALAAARSLLSLPFAIDSTGIKTLTISHGMSFTPHVHDIQLTVVKDSPVDDWTYNLLKIENADATNIIVKINISAASATLGMTAKLALLIIAPKYSGGDLINQISWLQQSSIFPGQTVSNRRYRAAQTQSFVGPLV